MQYSLARAIVARFELDLAVVGALGKKSHCVVNAVPCELANGPEASTPPLIISTPPLQLVQAGESDLQAAISKLCLPAIELNHKFDTTPTHYLSMM